LRTVREIIILLIISVFCLSHNTFAQDTVPVPATPRHFFKAEPLKATMLAVAFPGLGQIYNRKYWKIPLVYAGFGGLAYSINFNGKNYNKMMKAYQDFTDAIPETQSYIALIRGITPDEYDPVLYPHKYVPSNASWVKDRLLAAVDYYKKYRDLSYIGIAAWYLISVLDANVDASLFNYDVSNKLDVAITPATMPMPGIYGAGLNISLIFTF
jgi:hypothetical protein